MSLLQTRSNGRSRYQQIYEMVLLAVLGALVVVLQLWGSGIRIGVTNLSLVLIPIVVGALAIGLKGGIVLGLLFGVITVLFGGVMAMDPFTATLFTQQPLLTTLTCVGKGVGAGACPALLYRLLSARFPRLSVVIAAASAPIANTGLFVLGALTMLDTLTIVVGDVLYFFFFTILVCNFLVEFAANVIAGPAIHRVLQAIKKK